MMIQWPEATNEIVLHNESFYDKTFEESKERARNEAQPSYKKGKVLLCSARSSYSPSPKNVNECNFESHKA